MISKIFRKFKKSSRLLFYRWEYLYYRFFYSKPKLKLIGDIKQNRYLICDREHLDFSAKTFYKLFPDKVRTKIKEADLICEHIFDLLGSGPKKLSPEGKGYQTIDWHSDFKSGYCWDAENFFTEILIGHKRSVDVKVPWELSCFHHLTILGQAFVFTRNKKYAEEFSGQISDWISNNKVGYGVNWKCPMIIAIRAVNWLIAMEFFGDKELFSKEFLEKFYVSLYEHGKFIRSHLENLSVTTHNHYLSDIAGLFFIAVYCPFFRESKRWQKFALKELSLEIEKQVYEDGCDFESSTSYHRLVLEMLFYCELLGKRAGIEFPEKYRERLLKMFEFSLYCIKPNGMIPQIGDNDSGRFLRFSKRPVLEHKYLLTLASVYYKTSEFKLHGFDYDEEAFWVFGVKGRELYDKLPYRKEFLISKSFPNAGWYIIRHNNNYCFISCGYNGQNGHGGHAHNDKLSFELMIDGNDILVDPGTYVYTSNPEDRNRFRSTEYHNTIKLDGCEQSEILHTLFTLRDKVNIKKAELIESQSEISFYGEIQYEGIIHKRIITVNKNDNTWNISDSISCLKPVDGKLLFHLSPNIDMDVNCIFIKNNRHCIATIKTDEYSFEKGYYEYSPEYGKVIKAVCLNIEFSANFACKTLKTSIRPYNSQPQ